MFTLLISITFFAFVYFIPTFIASSQRNKYIVELFLVNLLLGWTIAGWLGVLLFTAFWKEQWKVKWNEKYVTPKKEPRDVNDHLKYHEEINTFIKNQEDVS